MESEKFEDNMEISTLNYDVSKDDEQIEQIEQNVGNNVENNLNQSLEEVMDKLKNQIFDQY